MHSRYISISITDTIVIQEFIYILARIQFTLIILVFLFSSGPLKFHSFSSYSDLVQAFIIVLVYIQFSFLIKQICERYSFTI